MAEEPFVFTLKKRNNDDSEDDWDRYSENVRPTRRGRKIDALLRKPEEVVTEAMAREKLDILLNELQESQNSAEEDELPKILEFCSWFEEKLAVGSHKLYYELLWKIISRKGFIEKYMEDERMLKIWEKMADNSAGHAHEIYQFAISRNSLIKCAALYARWSQSVELAGAVVEARRVLLLARTNCAVPLKILNDAEDELEMREMRRHLQERESDDDEDMEETRKAFTNLPVIGEKHTVPIVRLPSICSDSTKKAMKFDTENVTKVQPVCTGNLMQPFEVLPHADADDVEYLKNVHELNAHIERYAIKETVNPSITGTSSSSSATIYPVCHSGFEVWTIEGSNPTKAKARMTIKRIFKEISFEEYAASLLPNHPSMIRLAAKKLDFDETL
uniref:BUB1 N-terminal domain-containing protein n=1 Tax=Caenorhabditis tropicalis TaxID=1561998 RepID=A0A1I7UXL6_9PELO